MAENKCLKFIVRRMQLSDFEEVMNIYNTMDSCVPRYFNHIMIKIDPDGLFVAQDTQTGKLLGLCSGVNVSSDLAFMGEYIVHKDYQGLGIGSALWKEALKHVGTERNISLYAELHMIDRYRDKGGFKIVPERRCIRFNGKVKPELLIESIDGISVVNINENNVQNVIEYDQQICGFDRSLQIRETSKIDESDYTKRVAINRDNQVVGYCVVCVSNFDEAIVEPLYADNERIAELLLRKCCESLIITQTVGLVFFCWDTNPRAVAIGDKLGLSRSANKTFPIMFTKKAVDGDLDRIFCLNSLCFYPC